MDRKQRASPINLVNDSDLQTKQFTLCGLQFEAFKYFCISKCFSSRKSDKTYHKTIGIPVNSPENSWLKEVYYLNKIKQISVLK